MKNILFLFLVLPSFSALASVVGISTHPLNDDARVLSAEMTGFMSNRHEMGAGLRYTKEVGADKLLDITASGGQESRALTAGMGMDFALFREGISQPRFSLKPYMQYQKYEDSRQNLLGVAPTLRKGVIVAGYELFPFMAIPTGMKVDSANDKFDYYASLSFGASMNFPWADTDKLLLSLEGNKNMGASSDYVGALVSWVWR